VQKFGYLTEEGVPVRLNNNIFVLFAMMMFITTGMLMMAGVIAELLIRIYPESQAGRLTRFAEFFAKATAPCSKSTISFDNS
jgi:hypothetical protein